MHDQNLFPGWMIVLWIIVICAACQKSKDSKETYLLQIGEYTIRVEIADSSEKRITGLMYRQSLLENSGMLFVYKKPEHLSFWMKNTHIPLSVAFIDSEGVITEIIEMQPYDGRPDYMLPSYTSQQKVPYALEMRQGWFSRHNIVAGTRVKLPDFLKIKRDSHE